MAPLVRLLGESAGIDSHVCVTAQHRSMLDQVLELFEIVPGTDLDIMRDGQDLYDVTSRILTGMRDVITEERPDVLLVHGDTATTMAASLAAYYARVPVGHVEAGLRTRNIYSPWPEEINRQVAGRIASLHFAPTERARENLLAESVPKESIHVTGNTVIDALQWVAAHIEDDADLHAAQRARIVERLGFDPESTAYVLVTGHRRENFGQGFLNICEALKSIASRGDGLHVVYPVHLNPNVQRPVMSILGGIETIHLLEPLDYLPFVYLMNHARIILTDSGGIQEEAPSLGKPVLVMRDTTERPEAVDAGTVRLVGTDPDAIVSGVTTFIDNPAEYERMSAAHNPYGDGHASERIRDVLLATAKKEEQP